MLKRKETYEKKKEKILRERYGESADKILAFAKKHGATMKLESLESILRLMELRKKENREMYTVKELIEALENCPQDYQIKLVSDTVHFDIESVGIDNDTKTVDLFSE
jgi:type III secretion system FlhB-like substrate exporter